MCRVAGLGFNALVKNRYGGFFLCPGALLGERRQDLQRIGRSDEAVAGAGFEDVGGLPVRGVMGARRFAARAGEVAGDAFAAGVV